MQSKHEDIKYPGNQCDYKATQKSNLNWHRYLELDMHQAQNDI